MKRLAILSLALVVSGAANAGTEFGTDDEARALAEQLVGIIEQDGIAAAAQSVLSADNPFVHSRMGVNLFAGSMIIADNREPESVASDYGTIVDLTGERIWPRLMAAADAKGDAVLLWYHYDTQEPYEYHCLTLRAVRDDGMVMVCR